ncbi:CNNM domain-containing protein [Desulfovibrio sp. UCD-KL4C]|uniref:CNNM domain-containing protein n=1 Tax=Desulfovibrio sp. UCD-KL4C TaxID=2578120 RepID=UPI0025BB9F28|nr:CNNM domain-containing protein [Desulfovibrio sp. UCD-KL4C]
MLSYLIFFFLFAITCSFLCSLWEAVLLSITPSYIQIQIYEKTAIATTLKHFKENIDKPLAAILTLNTIAHTVGAIGVGKQAAVIWADENFFITGFVVPALMTLAILVLSELIPKTIGANYWKELTAFTVWSISLIIKILFPLVWFSQFLTTSLKNEKNKSVFSRTDFLAMAQVGADKGVLEKKESYIINNLLKFKTITVKDVMTPRVMIAASQRDDTLGGFHESNPDMIFSRIILFGKSIDDVTGYFLKQELLESLTHDKHQNKLKVIERKIPRTREDSAITDLLDQLILNHEHIALVIDPYGGTSGVVTIEDVIETLLGVEIMDESDKVADIQLLARKSWEKRAISMGLLVDSSKTEE